MEEVVKQEQTVEPQKVERAAAKRPTGKAKRRPCSFCLNKVTFIDYKDVNRLRKYIAENGKIISRRQTGLCAKHQRELTTAVKRARNMSLI